MKRFKDPLYGYIDVEDSLIKDVIDTPTFQRLRNIIQTSYSPLYATAVHNRFVHSLGVYHLAKIASRSIYESFGDVSEHIEAAELTSMLKIFEYASLLHDVGHSPFSHTGESFYLKDGSRDKLHKIIVELTGDQQLKCDIEYSKYTAAPHELMSAIVALKNFSELIGCENKSFFARCILGYNYVNPSEMKEKIANKIISLLNSTIIDVDKLDYLLRDAFITGFDTVSIDYKRLLGSVNISIHNEICELVFLKSGLSVIENVVYAHDAERKWIQNHPVIIYESNLLRNAMEAINKEYDIFNYETLTVGGKKLNDGSQFNVRLLCDSDILFLMKNTEHSSVNEYLDRRERRSPLWKSESEYKAIFNQGFSDKTYKVLEDNFDELLKYLNTTNASEINDYSVKKIELDISENEVLMSKYPKKQTSFQTQIRSKKKTLKLLKCLKNFAEEEGLDFDFIILKANQFNSGFAKPAFGELKIQFKALKSIVSFKEVTNVLAATKSDRDKFYYIYYKKSSVGKAFNINTLARELGKFVMDETYD